MSYTISKSVVKNIIRANEQYSLRRVDDPNKSVVVNIEPRLGQGNLD